MQRLCLWIALASLATAPSLLGEGEQTPLLAFLIDPAPSLRSANYLTEGGSALSPVQLETPEIPYDRDQLIALDTPQIPPTGPGLFPNAHHSPAMQVATPAEIHTLPGNGTNNISRQLLLLLDNKLPPSNDKTAIPFTLPTDSQTATTPIPSQAAYNRHE